MDISQIKKDNFMIVVHGGAGLAERSQIDLDKEKLYKESILECLKAGFNILKNNGSSLEAVEAAIAVMEDNTLFNAGRGSVLNEEGFCEMDASIMDGSTLKSGGVCSARTIKNPIKCCKHILEKSEHVLFSGQGADRYAKQHNIETMEESYFITENRKLLQENQKKCDKTSLDEVEVVKNDKDDVFNYQPVETPTLPTKIGTVGCVAIDVFGNMSAGTSSGGISNKKLGRVGDSPVIGSGTYANNDTCAISMTGHGEFIIRAVAAYDIHCNMEYGKKNLKEACNHLIYETLDRKMNTKAGLIAVDREMNVEMPFNSYGMSRGFIDKNGEATILLYDEKNDMTPLKYRLI